MNPFGWGLTYVSGNTIPINSGKNVEDIDRWLSYSLNSVLSICPSELCLLALHPLGKLLPTKLTRNELGWLTIMGAMHKCKVYEVKIYHTTQIYSIHKNEETRYNLNNSTKHRTPCIIFHPNIRCNHELVGPPDKHYLFLVTLGFLR